MTTYVGLDCLAITAAAQVAVPMMAKFGQRGECGL
jgi:hypothetical protein